MLIVYHLTSLLFATTTWTCFVERLRRHVGLGRQAQEESGGREGGH